MNSKYETTGINNLIKKYENQIAIHNEQIKRNQLQIEKDSKTVCHLQSKIHTLKETIVELKKAGEEEAIKNITETLNSTKCVSKTEAAEKKWGGLDTKTPTASANKCANEYIHPGEYVHPDWGSEKTWSECSKELNKLIEELNKKNNTTQVDFYTSTIWPADLGM